MSESIIVIVRPQTTMIVESGYQTSVRKFSTVEAMMAVIGRSGDLAYCYNRQDVWWKWVMATRSWEQTNI
jgi:hypothetical protein